MISVDVILTVLQSHWNEALVLKMKLMGTVVLMILVPTFDPDR